MIDQTSDQTTTELVKALRSVLDQVAEPALVLRTILEQAVSRTGADRGIFVEVGLDRDLDYRVLHGFQPKQLGGRGERFSRHLFSRVLDSGEPVLLHSLVDDPELAEIESAMALQTAAILCMPIRAHGRIAALVHLEHRVPGHFRAEHGDSLRSLLDVAGPILEALQTGRGAITERDRLRASENQLRDEAETSRSILAKDWSFGRFVGRSPAVRELESSVRKAAATEFPVLLTGETGTGKGVLARVLHYAGSRASKPLITVFCPSLERNMVEAELFGHRRGAFTGALSDRVGKVQAAEKGTLFLDEIGELPLEIQPKLLRLLQEKTYERIGDAHERRADVRIVAATNRDLEVEVQAGRFRQDLFERLNFLPIRVPPLRERRSDIPALLRYCLDQNEIGRWVTLTPEAERDLVDLDYTWPGNVRQLEQLAVRVSVEGGDAPFGAESLKRLLGLSGDGPATPPHPERVTEEGAVDLAAGLPALLRESEKAWLLEALRRYPDLTRAELAEKLKISEATLYNKLKLHAIGG